MKKINYLDKINSSPTLDEIKQRPRLPVCVVLDNIRSLYNVGSIFRTSDAAGVEKLYLCGITARPPRAEISKSALGSDKSVPWEYFSSTIDAIREVKSKNYQIVILEHTDEPNIYCQVKYQFPVCLVLGHEITGVSDEVVDMADLAVEIPMSGIKQSLNVAVAYGIAVYEIARQFRK